MSCILLYCIALYCEPSIIDNKSTVLADGHTVAENTGSLLTSEVKRHRARLVLGWGTAWEDLGVLSAFYCSLPFPFYYPFVHLSFHRSHFGSRYKLGCCGNASLFARAQ